MTLNAPHLLSHKRNEFSQNGEDGILQHIFSTIGEGGRQCCEFGAWDGIHFSNCRTLILRGWSCVMIEGLASRYDRLVQTYNNNPRVQTINCFVGTHGNSLDEILGRCCLSGLDLLSIDIDGLDYEILAGLSVRPRVVCVEVNAGHSPEQLSLVPRETARNNVGQSLGMFSKLAREMGYELAGYNGNAFFVRRDCMDAAGWTPLTPSCAYDEFLGALTLGEREWLYLVNLALVGPMFAFQNDRLTADALGISRSRAACLRIWARVRRLAAAVSGG